MLLINLVALVLFLPRLVNAKEYNCNVEKKFDSENSYTVEDIKKSQFSINIEEHHDKSFVSRCSFGSRVEEVTCDRYSVDTVVFDENTDIKKFYIFDSHFDFQLFPNLLFVENNGRGGIAYGKCREVRP